MTRNELEKHLGRNVILTLFDGDVITGILHKTGEDCFKNNPNFYIPKNYYVCIKNTHFCSCLFRVSHIKNFKEME